MLLGPPKLDFHQKRPSPFKFNTIFSPAIRNDFSKNQRVELTHCWVTNAPLLYPLKTENLRFSDVFRVYRSGILVENGSVEIAYLRVKNTWNLTLPYINGGCPIEILMYCKDHLWLYTLVRFSNVEARVFICYNGWKYIFLH